MRPCLASAARRREGRAARAAQQPAASTAGVWKATFQSAVRPDSTDLRFSFTTLQAI